MPTHTDAVCWQPLHCENARHLARARPPGSGGRGVCSSNNGGPICHVARACTRQRTRAEARPLCTRRRRRPRPACHVLRQLLGDSEWAPREESAALRDPGFTLSRGFLPGLALPVRARPELGKQIVWSGQGARGKKDMKSCLRRVFTRQLPPFCSPQSGCDAMVRQAS